MLQKELVETEVRTMIGIPMAPEIHMAVPERRETFHGTNSLWDVGYVGWKLEQVV